MQAIQSWWKSDNLLQSSPHSHKSGSRHSRLLSSQHVRTIHSSGKIGNMLQNRPHTPESSFGDARASAILHGPKSPNQLDNQPGHDRARRLRKAEGLRSPPPSTAQTARKGVRSNKGRKRRTRPHASSRGRRRGEDSVELEDEAYIRRTMHVPTKEDYPTLKASTFEQPKGKIYRLVTDGTLEKELNRSRGGVFTSTISGKSLGIGAVKGESTSKVSWSGSSRFVR